MPRWDTVAIIGVGLIGGSIGLALRERGLARQVIGIGRRSSSLRAARRAGAVTHTTTQLASGVRDAELVVVCTPIDLIAPLVLEAAEHCPTGALVTDAGSTKTTIVRRVDGKLPDGVAFIGSHPLAGSEKSGPLAARPDLLDGRLVVITPTRRTPAEAIARLETFWQSLGATVARMTARQHDRAMAAISHLPHLVAAALAAATPPSDLPWAATGWQDTTRIAAGDVQMWQQILSDNRRDVLRALIRLQRWLDRYRAALEQDDKAALAKLLEAGKQKRDAVGN